MKLIYIILIVFFISIIVVGPSIFSKYYSKPTTVSLGTSLNTASPNIKYSSVDDYIDYLLPEDWRKEINKSEIDGTYPIELFSPNFIYNSIDNENDGIKIVIIRQKYAEKIPLKDKLIRDGNPYIATQDFKIEEITIAGKQAYLFPSNNDGMGHDPNFPHITLLKDGYQYSFLFYGSGKGLERDIESFIKSIKFQD